jgi:hypothetical protein
MTGMYDTLLGTGDPFEINWGALMGCPLSTQKARILLDTLVPVMRKYVRGVRLYGSGHSAAIDLQADDLAGIVHDEKFENALHDFTAMWELCCAWSVASGCRIGLKGKAKTALLALRVHADLTVTELIGVPTFHLPDGSALPRLGSTESYCHMGAQRQMDGGGAKAAQVFLQKGAANVARLGALRISTACHMRIADIVVAGSAMYFGTTHMVDWNECERVEARWRSSINSACRRACSSPRVDLYTKGR